LQKIVADRIGVFLPSVEVDMGQEIFLPADPWTLLKFGKIADVPLIAGFTTDESLFFIEGNRHR
jgi:carboxylesterase type B